MSVYTSITQQELTTFLGNYDVGELVDYSGISDGIENTNYFVNTRKGSYVLTLFEEMGVDELPFFMDLQAHLTAHGAASAQPIADKNGDFVRILKSKPAALVVKLKGRSVTAANKAQCLSLGTALGTIHKAGLSFKQQRNNPRGPSWWADMRQALGTQLSAQETQILDEELEHQLLHRNDKLPRGIIHADLFRDNALLENDAVVGVIDFYYACTDVLLYDLAVTINDWCSNEDGSLDELKMQALMMAYNQQRPLTPEEYAALPLMLRAAALRFWLSRLYDKTFPREGEITHTKDPDVFKRILLERRLPLTDMQDVLG